jgi:hypothetical protein
MRKLLIVDDLGDASFEVAFQKYLKIFTIDLLVDIVNDFLENLLQKTTLVLFHIVLLIIETDNFIVKVLLFLVKIDKFIGRAKEEGILFLLEFKVYISFNIV